MAQLVRNIMQTNLVTLPSDATAVDAAERMRDYDTGDVVVVDRDKVVGIVTDRDLVIRVIAETLDPIHALLANVCSEDLVSIAPDASIGDAARLMRENVVRRLLVLESNRLIGIISLGDLAIESPEQTPLSDIGSAEPDM